MFSRVRSGIEAIRTQNALVVGVVSGSHVINHAYLVLLAPIVGVLATEFDASLGTIGLAMGALGVTNTALQLPFGYLSDNYSRTLTLALSLLFGTLGAIIVALSPTFAWLVVGQLVMGVGIAAHHPAHFPLLADATRERHRGRAFSIHGFAGSLGFAAPPAIYAVGLIIPGTTWRHVIGLVAVTGGFFSIVALLVLVRFVDSTLTGPPTTDERSDAPLGERVVGQLRSFVESPVVLALALLALVTSTASWGVTSFAVVLLTDGYGVEYGSASLALSVMFGAGALAILLGGELADRIAPGPVILVSYSLVVLFVVGVASMVIPPEAALLGVVAIGAARSLSGPARSKLTDAVSARDDLGQNFAVITVGIMLGGAIAPPLFGAIIERGTPQIAFSVIAVIATLAIVIVVAILRTFNGTFASPSVSKLSDD